MQTERLISQKQILKLRDELKKYTKKWVIKVAIKMSTKKEPVDEKKVYNIVSDVIRDNEWRNKFVKAANELIAEYKELQETPIL
jgi:GTPase involved in cell partitioning and DNA repair